jgi:hypothetical protein
MAEQDYEELDETLDRGDNYEDDEDQDESIDEVEETDDDESDEADIDLDEEEEEEEEAPPKEIKIPKSRLDEVIKQREEAKERNLWLEAQLEKLIAQSVETKKEAEKIIETVSTYDFEDAENRYVNLIIEGETSKAAKLRTEIEKERQTELKNLISSLSKSASEDAKNQSSAIIEEGKFNNLVENFESKYKFLDSESKEYNEEAVDTVNTLLAGYVAAGKSKAEGLKLAVGKVAPLYTKVVETKQSLGNKRKVEAGKKAAQAANSQPTKTKSVSTRQVDKEGVNVSKMSEKEFSQLTEKEKRILRGD